MNPNDLFTKVFSHEQILGDNRPPTRRAQGLPFHIENRTAHLGPSRRLPG
ncbi:MAG: hypothetical protein KJZ93_26110 [Caldilineaceae bacterium]|nr:hypothetical protein [Caldilineaceae bacterium]